MELERSCEFRFKGFEEGSVVWRDGKEIPISFQNIRRGNGDKFPFGIPL